MLNTYNYNTITNSNHYYLPEEAPTESRRILGIIENKFLEAENEVQKIVVPIQLLHVKVEGLRTQIDQDRPAFMSLNVILAGDAVNSTQGDPTEAKNLRNLLSSSSLNNPCRKC